MQRAFLCVSSAALSQLGTGILGGDPLSASQNLFVALLKLTVVSVVFIISMSKNPKLGYFHTALGVLPVLASCVTRSPKHYPAFPAASPQHSCDKNTPGFGQATLGDPTACPGSCAAVTVAKRCHGVTSVLQGMPWAPLPSSESRFPPCPFPHVVTLLSESGLLPQPVCVSLLSVHCGLLLLEVPGSLVTL